MILLTNPTNHPESEPNLPQLAGELYKSDHFWIIPGSKREDSAPHKCEHHLLYDDYYSIMLFQAICDANFDMISWLR